MNKHAFLKASAFVFLIGLFVHASAQNQPKPNAPDVVAGIPVNYDESQVGSYTLPDPLKGFDSRTVSSKEDWIQWRRPELLTWYRQQQYGEAPPASPNFTYEVVDPGTPVFQGKAIRKQIILYLNGKNQGPRVPVVLYLPANKKPAPVLLHLSFTSNSASVEDTGLLPDSVWNPKTLQREPTPKSSPFNRTFPVEAFIQKGIGVANLYYGDIEPDFLDGIQHGGIRKQYLAAGKTQPASQEWGAISAWAWGLSRVMDYLEKDPDVNSKQVAVNGHSRLGKTVLFTGVNDDRFSMVIASCSGEGGAALSRRNYGETIGHLVAPTRYPYQFAQNYQQYQAHPDQMKTDSHLLVSLVAPRPLLLITGTDDHWSDPKGEFLAAVAAAPVYELFGKQALGVQQLPPADQPILHDLGFLMHQGGHSVLPQDIQAMIQFMKQHWK